MAYSFVYHLLMLLVVVLLWRQVVRHSPTSLRRFALLSFLGILAAALLSQANGNLAAHAWAWHGSLFLFGSALLIFRQRIDGRRRIAFPTTILVFTVIYLLLCVDALLIEPTALQVRHLTIMTEKVTRPMRILFMADFQTDRIGKYERRTLLTAKAQNPDLILWGGDYLQARGKEQDERLTKGMNELLREIDFGAPLGIYAVKGNQEIGRYYDWKRCFNDTNVVPVEKTRSFDVGEIRLTLLEMYASFRNRPVPDRRKGNKFRIILGHCPSFAVADQDADLLLAGHTHGGQILIPGFGPLFGFAPLMDLSPGLPRRWGSGVTELPNGSTLVVTHGTGMERGRAPRVRLFCRPDLWVIDLLPVSNTSATTGRSSL